MYPTAAQAPRPSHCSEDRFSQPSTRRWQCSLCTRDGKVKLLAVTGAARASAIPDVPTFGELKMNLGDIEDAEMWYGFLAPGKSARTTIQKLNVMLVEALKDPAVRELLWNLDVEVATGTPEEFAKLIKADYERWGAVIKSTGFTLSE